MKSLVFQVHGPLMSFGAKGADRRRPTRRRPTRSGVLGLVMGAMGVKRKDETSQQLVNKSLAVSSLTCSAGTVQDDYHTIRVPKEDELATRRGEVRYIQSNPNSHEGATKITQRSFVSDTYCRVALTKVEETSLDLTRVARALEKPEYLPFVGRRGFPLGLPLRPEIKSELGKETFRDYESTSLSEQILEGISGSTVLATELPGSFECDFPTRVDLRDDRVAAKRRFRERKEWTKEVNKDVF